MADARRPGTIPTVATITTVDDVADPRVDDFRDLTAADRRPDRPGGRGLVIAEGVVVVRRLLDSPYPVRSLLGRAAAARRAGADLAALDAPAYATDADTMASVVGFHLNRGVLAVADRAPPPRPGRRCRDGPAAWPSWRASTTTRTWVRCSATPPRSASTACCSAPAAPTRSTGAACGSPWDTCCGCRSRAARAVAGRRSTAARRRAHGRRAHARARRRAAGRCGSRRRRVALLLGAEGPGSRPRRCGRAPARADPHGDRRRLAQRGYRRRRRFHAAAAVRTGPQ